MPEYHGWDAGARRPFLVTPYVADADGRLVAAMPDRCPWHRPGDAQCWLWVDHQRERKTGPCFPLLVVCCGLHGRAFTLYPHGHVPYGRVAVAPVTADGGLVRGEPSAEGGVAEAPGRSGTPLGWSSTLFGAALDAAGSQAWPRTGSPGWRTQRRWLERGAQLVGITPRAAQQEQQHRERMARRLGVPTLVLVAGARSWSEARGYRDRGEAITEVLAELERAPTVGDRLLSAGALGGLWGAASRWEPDIQTLRRVPFS